MPERLRRFIQNEVTADNQENDGRPGFVPFTAHDFRDTAMTRAWDAGISGTSTGRRLLTAATGRR